VLAIIPLAALGALAALLTTAAATGNRTAAVVASVPAALIGAGGLTLLAARLVSDRRPARRWLAAAVAVVTVGIVAVFLDWLGSGPANPNSPPLTADVRFWDLPTGSRIAYTHTPAQGPAKPTPVVLVHGGPGAPATQNQELARELAAAGFQVYDYHQIGAGLSARLGDPGQYTVARHIADLDGIRHALGADRLVLAGASWGGKLIVNYLAAHPERVAAAVVDSPSEIWSPAFTDSERLTDAGRLDQEAAVRRQPRFAVAHVLMSVAGPRTARTLLPDAPMDAVFESLVAEIDMRPGCPTAAATGPTRQPPQGFGFWVNAVTTMDAGRVADPRPALRNATAPVLVLRAQCDYIAWEVTREYRDVLPNATLLGVAGAGHTVTTDRPDLHRRLVRAFLLGEPLPLPAHRDAQSPWGPR
jgi:proline iminopeptidase